MRSTFLFAVALLALSACGPDWREYRSEAGNYSVRFPGARTMERDEPGRGSTVHITHVEVDKKTAYGVSWFDIAKPERPAGQLLLDVQAEVLRDLKATAARAGEIKLGPGPGAGAPGRAFAARTANGLDVSIRVYAVGSGPVRVYQLIAAVPDAKRAEGDIGTFFESFKLLK
ncbi:MAG TPA: hypothetical protein VIF14_16055 [Alphaproteobacteria bacterium]|jgi:hypothetical protein